MSSTKKTIVCNTKKNDKINNCYVSTNLNNNAKVEETKYIEVECNNINKNIKICSLCGKTDNISNKYNIPICEFCLSKFSEELKYVKDPNDISGILRIVDGAQNILNGLRDLYGIDPNDDNFKDTPKRIARLMLEMNYGTNIQAANDILNVSFPTNNEYRGLVSSNNIRVNSLCPHHLIAVNYEVSIAYIPNDGKYIGLSKLPRLAKTLAKSMLLQEDYTKKIIDVLEKQLHPQGCAVMVSGIHNCVQCRGVSMQDVKNITVELSGAFALNPELKKEWLATIQLSKNC